MRTKQTLLKRSGPTSVLRRASLLALSALLACLMVPTLGFAADNPVSTIDHNKKGSLTIRAFHIDGTTGLDGAVYSYKKVADITQQFLDNGSGTNTTVYYNVDTAFLAAIGTPNHDVSDTVVTGGGYTAATLQTALFNNKATLDPSTLALTPMSATTGGSAGTAATATATGLDTGLYVVFQTNAPSSLVQEAAYTEPFLVTLPSSGTTNWNYDITVTAKNVTNDESVAVGFDRYSTTLGDKPYHEVSMTVSVTPDGTHYENYSMLNVLDPGFTLPASPDDVTVSSSSLTLVKGTDYTVEFNAAGQPGNSILFALTEAGLEKINVVPSLETIKLYYRPTLNTSAVIGAGGNKSTVTLSYTHHNGISDPVSNSKTHYTLLWSYGATLKNVAAIQDSPVLPGAQFEIYTAAAYSLPAGSPGRVPSAFYTGLSNNQVIGSPVTTMTTDANGLASFFGLAEGDYYLVETKAPAGYSLMSDAVKITIKATTTNLTPTVIISNTPQAGHLGSFSLPMTGGDGIEIMVLGGTLLMVACGGAYLFYTRRKKNSHK